MNAHLDESALGQLREKLDRVRREVSRVFIGESAAVEHLLVALLSRGHVLVEGVPGVAKTTLARSFARAIGCEMRRIQFTPDLLPSDITGTYVLDPRTGAFSLRPGPIFANVVLADEINRAPAKTQSALLEAMQEGQATIEGEERRLPRPFLVLGTQNPVDLEGTYPLPEAQLDRFLVRVVLGYPEERAEVAMLRTHDERPPEASSVSTADEVLAMQELCRHVHAETEILEYVVALCRHTRKNPLTLLGASPRAALGLLHAAKARALLDARSFTTPDDVRRMADAVLTHRIVLGPNLDDSEDARRRIVQDALAQVPYSRIGE